MDQRFELLDEVGAGGMGVVHRARDRASGRLVAVKLLDAAHGAAVARFEREARVLAEVHHPAVVGYVAHGELRGRQFLAMEWLDGEDLRARLGRGRLTPGEVIALGARIAEGLAAAHARGVVHRDVKPSNVFLPGGDLRAAKLIDFGIARVLHEDSSLTRAGTLIGTPAYMSPEQARGERNIDGRSDLFSLAAVLYEALAGHPPHRGGRPVAVLAKIVLEDAPPLRSVRPDAPAALEALLGQLLARDRARRPADAAAVAAWLRELGEGHAPEAPVPPADAGALTAEAARLVCVVLATPERGVEAGSDAPTVVDEPGRVDPLASTEADEPLPSPHLIARRHGARIEPLLGGRFAAVISSASAATDLCDRAARLALALREVSPGTRLSLAVGTAVLSRALAIDAIIEEVAALASQPRPPSPGAGVRVDDVAARLLGSTGYRLVRDDHGAVLAGPAQGSRVERATPLVGRGRELRRLRAILTRWASKPHARALLVTGAPGIGKSRLVVELLAARELAGAAVWSGRGDPLQQATPFGLLAPLVREAAGLGDGADAAAARARLDAWLAARGVAEPGRVGDFLAVLAGVPATAAPGPELAAARQNPILLADQVERAWVDLVLAVTARAPLVLVLEDLHLGDAPTVKLVEAALRVARDRPLLAVAAARPEVHATFPELFAAGTHDRLDLAELDERAALRLVARALPGAPRALRERLAARGAGNAFYLEELARSAAEGASDALPGSVLAMAMARLEALDDEGRRCLRAASVFGERFRVAGVARLLGRPAADVAPAFERLAERGWVDAGEGGDDELLRFRHALLHEAAYATLTDEDRRLGHRLAGLWLDERGGEDAAVLAQHFARGDDPARAAAWYQRAAEHALASSDLAGALARARDAEASGARGAALGEVRLVEATARHWLGEHDAALDAALEAVRLLPPLGAAWFRAVDGVAEACLPVGDVDTLEALADAAGPPPPALAPDQDTRAAALAAAATVSMQLALGGRHAPAQAVMARLERELSAGAPPPPLVAARAEFARTAHAVTRGDLGEVVLHARAAILAYEAAGDQRSAALMTTNLAWALAEIGAFDEAEAPLRAAAATAERMGLAFLLGAVQNNLALVLARRGELPAARAAAGEALRLYRGADNRRVEGMVHIYLAMIEDAAGALAAAEREARHAAELLAAFPPTRTHALAILAHVLLRQGRAGEAASVAGEAAAALEALGSIDEGESLVRLVRAESLHAAGATGEARVAIAAAADAVRARAARISAEAWRVSFLARVPENARTLTLAAAWA